MDIGTPEIGQHPGHRDVPKGPSNTKRDHFGITKLDLAMTQGRKDLSNEQQRTTTSSKRAQRARSQTTKADVATNRPIRALSWGTKPIMRVLLYCFKPPLPSAAASPPPRRAVGPSARIPIRSTRLRLCVVSVQSRLVSTPTIRTHRLWGRDLLQSFQRATKPAVGRPASSIVGPKESSKRSRQGCAPPACSRP